MLDVIKDISAVLGIILSFSAVLTLCSKSAKTFIGNIFKRYGNDDGINDIKEQLGKINEKLDSIESLNTITVDFTREQCRTLIKDMFFKYYDTQVLPVYEYKMLLKLEDFYINRLHGNTFIRDIIKTMKAWQIDYSQTHAEEDE